MSFSGDVKEELSRQNSLARHCQIAELAAIISLCGKVMISEEDKYSIHIHTENTAAARKYYKLLKESFHIRAKTTYRQNAYLKKGRTHILTIFEHTDALRVLQATRLLHSFMEIQEELSPANNLIVQQACCKRAYIRGAFLAAGSISDPEKFYHFEIVCPTIEKAEQLRALIQFFQIDAKIVMRKKYHVVYIKESSRIVDILNIMEAHVALLELENIRILKEMRNSVNRKVNCETANIGKTVSAAQKQIADIQYIEEHQGLDSLPESLKAVAQLRLEFPEMALMELGSMLEPSIGKSGVNHRLRKISEIAESIRDCLKNAF